MSRNYKVSVITICWNCVKEIEETLLSVIKQDYPNIEYIVIDGASTDGTLEIIQRHKENIDILISEKDTGIYNAMNKGVMLATGEWCLFMNGGDMFASDDIVSQMFAFRQPMSTTKVYYGNTWERYKNGEQVLLKAMPIYPTIKRCQPYIHQSAFFNIIYKKYPFYDERYHIVSDYNTSLWYYKKYGKSAFEYVNIPVSSYKNFDGASSRQENQRKKICEFLKIWKHNPICWSRYTREAIKYFIIYIQPFSFFKNITNSYTKNRVMENKRKRTLQKH